MQVLYVQQRRNWFMGMKEILNPKGWMIGLGVIVILAALGNIAGAETVAEDAWGCLLYTSPSPRDKRQSRMPSSA